MSQIARGRLPEAVVDAARSYSDHSSSQIAAAISYHVLFSVFPLAIFLVSVLGLVLQDDSVRRQATDAVIEALPANAGLDDDIAKALEGIATPASALGILGLLALAWSASGMMASIRVGLNMAWGHGRQPFLRGKLVDLGMLAAAGTLMLVSAAGTLIEHRSSPWSAAAGTALSVAVTFALFTGLYCFVPARRPPAHDTIPAAALAAAGVVLLKEVFALYLARFADYNVVYGSLGAVVASLFFVYLVASILLLGAEFGAAWGRIGRGAPYRSGRLDDR